MIPVIRATDLNLVPAMTAPAGQVSNLKNPPNQNKFMYLTAGICLGFSTLAVIFRLFVKARVLRAVQLEEFILTLSLCGLVSFTGIMIKATLLGQGVHMWNVSVAHAERIIEVGTAEEPESVRSY